MAEERRLLTRVVLKNYKSFAACDVSPAQLCFLVGRNGSGKSNFLDALRFIADSLRQSLDHALRDRGGIDEVRRRSGGHPTHFRIRVEFNLPDGAKGHYAFEVGAKRNSGYEVRREECLVTPSEGVTPHYYRVERGKVISSSFHPPPVAAATRLYLVTVSGLEGFRPVYDALSGMGFYNLNSQVLRDWQPSDTGELLKRDGSNAASVFHNIKNRKIIEEYLQAVVPGITSVERRRISNMETFEFRQEMGQAKHPWRFGTINMSDGTLLALSVLLALFQGSGDGGSRPGLIGIEEPEIALHPAAAGVLIDSMRDGAERTQILATSHSPDLLDDKDIPADSILAVEAEHGESRIGPIDDAGHSKLKSRLCTVGELLKADKLVPDPGRSEPAPRQLQFSDLKHA